ncbi:MAG: type IV secretion system protein VirB1 [Xanthobacter sp. 17-67-6]|jgi:type IV secretion system protein VirB1|nr:MAG: type IV secretion system protein VirB1 [Rhizobiales bacterium 32-66-11]OYY88602.1 MAG: type IV secretion system protein VirB1 [Rhizobiales bacterium 35-66-30]OYZ72330.1 MAG: type IV secretion system protein VirB1 [Rhizobiales bacterium 24-66-13]OYZ90490.1 MAG: type IV secretion system protein VirB1 [Xanthobacter sp. 17-67-6]OZB08890.1 MAG: type IV secretion system protein VirB1 [Rhizobiales bacterium 39-66-18]
MPVAFADLAQTCAPTVAVETVAAVASLESAFSPFAIRINSGLPLHEVPKTKAEAIEVATTLIAQHQDVDLGLGGVNADDLGRLDLTVADAFEPCANLKATARLLDGYYRAAINGGATPAKAETVMLQSYYGRGDASVGEMVGYDKQVRVEAKRLQPKLAALIIDPANTPGAADTAEAPALAQAAGPAAPRREAKPAPWDVFTIGRKSSVLVFQNGKPEQTE